MTYLKLIKQTFAVGLLATLPIFALSTIALSSSSAQAGGQGSGGGDPLARFATAYPDTDKLLQALQLVETQALKSGYPDDFKGQLIVEMNDLLKAEKYKLVPAIILPPGFWPEGYETPTDIDSFLDLGGLTAPIKGANIYLAERVRQYSNEQLSALLLHELIHHCVSYGLSTDEKFVEDLTASIMSGVRTHKLDLAFETKTYFRKDFISRDQMLEAMGFYEILATMPDLKRKQSIIKTVAELPKNLNDLNTLELFKNEELGWLSRCVLHRKKYFTTKITSVTEIMICLNNKADWENDHYIEPNLWDKLTALSIKTNPDFAESIKNQPEFEKSTKNPFNTRHAWQCQHPLKWELIQGPVSLLILPLTAPLYILDRLDRGFEPLYGCDKDDYFYTLEDLFVPKDE